MSTSIQEVSYVFEIVFFFSLALATKYKHVYDATGSIRLRCIGYFSYLLFFLVFPTKINVSFLVLSYDAIMISVKTPDFATCWSQGCKLVPQNFSLVSLAEGQKL